MPTEYSNLVKRSVLFITLFHFLVKSSTVLALPSQSLAGKEPDHELEKLVRENKTLYLEDEQPDKENGQENHEHEKAIGTENHDYKHTEEWMKQKFMDFNLFLGIKKQQNRSLKRRLEEMTQQIMTMTNNERMKQKILNLKKKFHKMDQRIMNMKKKLEIMKQQIMDMNNKDDKLKHQIENMKKEIERMEQEIMNMNKKLKRMKKQIIGMKNKKDKLKQKIKKIIKKIGRMEEQITNMNNQLDRVAEQMLNMNNTPNNEKANNETEAKGTEERSLAHQSKEKDSDNQPSVNEPKTASGATQPINGKRRSDTHPSNPANNGPKPGCKIAETLFNPVCTCSCAFLIAGVGSTSSSTHAATVFVSADVVARNPQDINVGTNVVVSQNS